MSYEVRVIVTCDAPFEDGRPCLNVFQRTVRNKGGLNATWAAYLAQREGWWVRGKTGSTNAIVAYCPIHKADRPDGRKKGRAAKYEGPET